MFDLFFSCVYCSTIDVRIYIPAQVIDVGGRNASLVSVVMEETGCLGANVIVDDGGKVHASHMLFNMLLFHNIYNA